jgi:hypothetical protein
VPGVEGRPLTSHVPNALKRRIPAVRERDALRREVQELRTRVWELEAQLDHERLFPGQWANRRVRDKFGNEVRSGPFAGMRYPDWALTAVDLFAPKLLGIYERELHDVVERLIDRSPEVVVNIGAADGYYAVGFARRLPHARVLAYEANEERAEQLVAIAELNGVAAQVEAVAAPARPETLETLLVGRAAVVCDCDGCEAELLDPHTAPRLRHADVLVETHDMLAPGTTERLERAFGSSHEIARIDAGQRFVDDFPEIDFMPLVTRQLAISEFRRAPMLWLDMTPQEGRL